GLEVQSLVRIARTQVVERYPMLRFLGLGVVDRLDLEEREVALAVLGRSDLSGHGVASAQIEALDLRGGDVDVVGAVEVVPVLAAEEAVPFGEDLEDSLTAQNDVRVEQILLDAEDEVLLSQ